MGMNVSSASALFAEKLCDSPDCGAFVPESVPYCRSCVRQQRRRNGGTGAGHPPRGRFEARVATMRQVARALDHAEAEHRSDPSPETHAALMGAFSNYRRAVRLMDQA